MKPASDDTRVFNQAMQWLSALQDGAADSAALFAWLAESPRHVEEFTLAMTFADEVRGLTNEQCARIAALNAAPAALNVVPLSAVQHSRPATPARPRWRLRAGAWAASVALAVMAGGWVAWDSGWKTYQTEIGEQKTVDLSDGSIIQLNTRSRIKVRYGDARDIQLLSGEALFKVQSDPRRPFRVHTDTGVIQAVGTAFNVYRRAAEVRVAVIEGSVKISSAENDGSQYLKAGEETRITATGQSRARPVDVTQATAWRQRRLVFRNDTLADIVQEFNRYNRRPQFRIEAAQLGAQRFAATFDADAPEALEQVLRGTPGLLLEKRGAEILIRSQPGGDQTSLKDAAIP